MSAMRSWRCGLLSSNSAPGRASPRQASIDVLPSALSAACSDARRVCPEHLRVDHSSRRLESPERWRGLQRRKVRDDDRLVYVPCVGGTHTRSGGPRAITLAELISA